MNASQPVSDRLGVLLSFSGAGGVERMMLNLLNEFAARDVALDVLTIRGDSAPALPAGLNVINLHARHTHLARGALEKYLRSVRPKAVLVAKDRAIRLALKARPASPGTRVVGRLGTNLSAALAGRNRLQQWFRVLPMKRIYRTIDCVVAVSEGVADDTAALTGLPRERITVIKNPVVSDRLFEVADECVHHPWLADRARPVIVGAGRLTRQKDFPTLLAAFAKVHQVRACRLLILGEGGERAALERQIEALGLSEDVMLPGHQTNLPAWLAKAQLFVLSSRWEGSPNVLTEAVALGTPVVATDCPSGPRELLNAGQYGPLVPVGDAEALAAAILDTLANPLPPAVLKEAAADYTAAHSAQRYLQVLGF